MSGPELARFLDERGATPLALKDFDGVGIDSDGNVIFPAGSTRPAVKPRVTRVTKATAVLPGGALPRRQRRACVVFVLGGNTGDILIARFAARSSPLNLFCVIQVMMSWRRWA
jgi:hypothetical protein